MDPIAASRQEIYGPTSSVLQSLGVLAILGYSAISDAFAPDPLMTDQPKEMTPDEMLRVKLEVLKREHRDLDEAITALGETGRPDQLTLRRLKKQKLALKDQITKIEDRLTPDIIA